MMIFIFWTKLAQKACFRCKKHGHCVLHIQINLGSVLHIQINLGTKFFSDQTNLNFWTKFTQRWYWRSKSEKVNITTEFCIFRLEESNYIFLASSDALVYLAEPMHKICSTTFGWGHPFSKYVSYDGY